MATYIDDNSISPTPDMQGLINTLNTLTVPQQQAALDAMTAQVNGTIAQLGVQDTAYLYALLRRRVGSAFASRRHDWRRWWWWRTGRGQRLVGKRRRGSDDHASQPVVEQINERLCSDMRLRIVLPDVGRLEQRVTA